MKDININKHVYIYICTYVLPGYWGIYGNITHEIATNIIETSMILRWSDDFDCAFSVSWTRTNQDSWAFLPCECIEVDWGPQFSGQTTNWSDTSQILVGNGPTCFACEERPLKYIRVIFDSEVDFTQNLDPHPTVQHLTFTMNIALFFGCVPLHRFSGNIRDHPAPRPFLDEHLALVQKSWGLHP